MIQKVNPGGTPATRPSPECWGSWGPASPYGRKYYSLEVVQHPIRARMCGFGDKDRRPLAPAAVAKMIVRREDNSIVDVDETDCSFFLVTVDLWSQDGDKEMNLVLHPTSSDRYVPSSAPKAKRRATTSSVVPPGQHSTTETPVSATPTSAQYSQSASMTPYIQPGYNTSSYPFPAQQPPIQESTAFQPVAPYGSQAQTPAWTAYSPIDRPASQFTPTVMQPVAPQTPGAAAPEPYSNSSPPVETTWQVNTTPRDSTGEIDYHTWPTERYPPLDSSQNTIDPSLRNPSMQTNTPPDAAWPATPADHYPTARYNGFNQSQMSPTTQQPQQQPQQPQSQPQQQSQHVDTTIYASASYAQQQQEQQAQAQYQGKSYAQETTPPSTIPPLPRHTYTRTLVGPLSANACRLLDEHRKPGIFFLFQDLSIRTEGTFRLRLRLMNVGAPPAPEPGGYRVHTGFSPVLAQTFTEPFIVYSAKRFPGVPDTTALSIALGNQGQKLPLRNRNNKQGRKRAHDESGEESE